MRGPLIKICGIRSAEDALHCQAAGVDYLGLIFANSPRQITPQGAAGIRAAVPDARLVGVFVNPLLAELQAVVPAAGLDLIQLHGDESPRFCCEVKTEIGVPVIKRIRPTELDGDSWLVSEAARQVFDYLLFDLPKTDSPMEEMEQQQQRLWTAAATATAAGVDVFLAGDLSETNIAQAIEWANPFAVDVCRGVETRPGVKDRRQVDRFIKEVRR